MKEVLHLLPVLAIAMILNIAINTWFNVKVQDFKFDWKILANGAKKALIIGVTYIGLAYIFTEVPSLTETLGITPVFIIILAIGTYTYDVVKGLAKVQGIKVEIKEIKQTSKDEE
ncbi:MAG TPA: hypothetical protein VFD00_05890 [Thermoclostridium sp.]|nr:hypothetical protein [Thermoclostridium sp.]